MGNQSRKNNANDAPVAVNDNDSPEIQIARTTIVRLRNEEAEISNELRIIELNRMRVSKDITELEDDRNELLRKLAEIEAKMNRKQRGSDN